MHDAHEVISRIAHVRTLEAKITKVLNDLATRSLVNEFTVDQEDQTIEFHEDF